MKELQLTDIKLIDWASSVIVFLKIKSTDKYTFDFELIVGSQIIGCIFKFEIYNSNLATDNLPYDFEYVEITDTELNLGGAKFKLFHNKDSKTLVKFYKLYESGNFEDWNKQLKMYQNTL